MKLTILADYKARTSTGSRIHIEANDLPRDTHHMICWVLSNPAASERLVQSWRAIKHEWDLGKNETGPEAS